MYFVRPALDAVDAEPGPGGKTVVSERAPRKTRTARGKKPRSRCGFFPRAARIFRGALRAPRRASRHDRRPPGPGILCIHCIQWIIHFAFHPCTPCQRMWEGIH